MGDIEICDVCGSTDIKAFKCKLICQNCGTILKTCSDLAGDHSPQEHRLTHRLQ